VAWEEEKEKACMTRFGNLRLAGCIMQNASFVTLDGEVCGTNELCKRRQIDTVK
jgi:hypothetical protein